MSNLISYRQIERNLRRTASNGLISLLNHQQLEDLAIKYFGKKDEYGNVIGYQCPYSGETYYTYEDIVLEHIVPVASNGGTVLFNCIPTSKEVNGLGQKGAKHLITWWINSKYWNGDAPQRLEKIVNYMLDGYEQVFKEYTVEEIESSYLDIETDGSIIDEEDNLEYSAVNESKLLKQAKNNGIHSYLGFILDCINTLENKEICNIDTTEIRNRLTKLQEQNIFEDIERYQLFQNKIQELIISRIGDDNRNYLTYTLHFDKKKLMDSINLDNEEEIYRGLDSRLQNIEQLLKSNNLSTQEYFKSLGDIQDIDIIYKDIKDITEEDIKIFLENIKIGTDTKIEIFINMLNEGNNNILKRNNTETLEGYPSIKLDYFWSNHQERIKQKLFVELKDNPKYNKARELIAINEMTINVEKQIPIFIDMLNRGNDKILKQRNKETLEGHPSIKLDYFWNNHKERIKQKLFVELKDNPEYDTARKLITINNMTINVEKQIPIFINMLNQGNSNILKYRNKETLEGYPNIKLANFWDSHKERIKQKLFIELKDNPEYNIARQTVLTYFKISSYEELKEKQQLTIEEAIEIFINMLNQGNSNILKRGNKETLEGYPGIKLTRFWNNHQERIKQKLFIELKDNPEYDTARKLIAINEMTINVENQIPIFINMLNQGNGNILKQGNKETLEGYPSINLSQFWNSHRERIKQKLFIELKDNPEYNKARELIAINEVSIKIENQIPIFIDMLNQGNSNILKTRNKETLEGYPGIKLAYFWNDYKDRIKQKLFNELKDNPEYDMARKIIDAYEMTINVEKQIPIFINMLNQGNSNILKYGNKETLEGYLSINLSHFWSKHQDRIKQKLFVELKDNSKYDIARQTVLTYYKVSTYEEWEEKQRKSKQLKEVKEMKKNIEEAIENIDKEEITEQRKKA